MKSKYYIERINEEIAMLKNAHDREIDIVVTALELAIVLIKETDALGEYMIKSGPGYLVNTETFEMSDNWREAHVFIGEEKAQTIWRELDKRGFKAEILKFDRVHGG